VTLRAGLKAEDANTRIRSAVAILDRAWGRPRQAVEAAVTVTPTVILDCRTGLAGIPMHVRPAARAAASP
jgi:hypothetical protein